jgi:bifunctional non-homologous end joining protein LigD
MFANYRRFVVKLHDATRLHFDFRLQYRGVYKSWVLLDGPCLDASQKRPAILVEDHAINDSERVIPDGMYGAGTVMVWDWGHWITDQDISEALRIGQLHFRLEGHKLRGSWTLTRLCIRSGHMQETWELRKVFDAEARSLSEFDVVVKQPNSVLTLRTMEEISLGLPSLMPGRRPNKNTRDPNQRPLFPDDLRS